MKFDIPILLITYDRPSLTKKRLQKILKINPKKIYIFSDFNPTNINNQKNINFIKSLNYNIKTFISDVHLGTGDGPRQAINWYFKNE